MVSLDTTQIQDHTTKPPNLDLISSPRISFSSEFLDDMRPGLMSSPICPNSPLANITTTKAKTKTKNDKTKHRHVAETQNFEFLSDSTTGKSSDDGGMISADELFFEGKLLPFWQAHTTERLAKLSLTTEATSASAEKDEKRKEGHVASVSNTWFVDDDPSPRPPKCTVLWKELLRLKNKQRRATSTLSPSSSSSSSSSSASSLGDAATSTEEGNKGKPSSHLVKSNVNNKDNSNVKGTRRSGGLERTRSATIRIRPMINVPICTAAKKTGFGSSLPPLFPLKKGKLFDR